ncbi:hypothetical protein Smp_139370 [Schistosoma mansoni]|uniref:hypothetical protein n=1 Tax=Schistosoma mansoni TaxID=6183 RepID=UPI0001A6318A|nr:hypothetical protein Smp_139370 [Schistosoma mansoni]|eukprot:XP_018653698.1 hypothetical protein Smp_139370 [Schistosoma mansoni]
MIPKKTRLQFNSNLLYNSNLYKQSNLSSLIKSGQFYIDQFGFLVTSNGKRYPLSSGPPEGRKPLQLNQLSMISDSNNNHEKSISNQNSPIKINNQSNQLLHNNQTIMQSLLLPYIDATNLSNLSIKELRNNHNHSMNLIHSNDTLYTINWNIILFTIIISTITLVCHIILIIFLSWRLHHHQKWLYQYKHYNNHNERLATNGRKKTPIKHYHKHHVNNHTFSCNNQYKSLPYYKHSLLLCPTNQQLDIDSFNEMNSDSSHEHDNHHNNHHSNKYVSNPTILYAPTNYSKQQHQCIHLNRNSNHNQLLNDCYHCQTTYKTTDKEQNQEEHDKDQEQDDDREHLPSHSKSSTLTKTNNPLNTSMIIDSTNSLLFINEPKTIEQTNLDDINCELLTK